MSKGSEGPSATSFENPRKVGWLSKHGGSGVSSHWKKRWFIVDHHYLFYYKGPNEKKPVGILCLPEYQLCRKAEGKDCKKPNSFVLDKGNDDNSDSAIKNYILCSDSEEDMRTWIAAISEEIKGSIGGNQYARGGGGAKGGGGGAKGGGGGAKAAGKKDAVKVDERAFDEVTAMASEGPKLTHITASRPKMKGRRPPKRYQVFHEEEEDSPPSTPVTPHKPLPPSPSPSSPSSSPSTAKRGSRPSAPMLPSKAPLTPPTKQRSITTTSDSAGVVENGDVPTPSTRPKPQPPRKPSKPATDSPSPVPDTPTTPVRTEVTTQGNAEEGTTAKHPPKPVPHKKPRATFSTSPPQQLAEKPSAPSVSESPNEVRIETHPPTPPQKPKPPAPKVKQRPSLVNEPPTSEASANQRAVSSPDPPTPTKRPTPVPRPVPIPRKRTASAVRQEEDKGVSEDGERTSGGEGMSLSPPKLEEVNIEDKISQKQDEVSVVSEESKPVDSEQPELTTSPDHCKEEEEAKEEVVTREEEVVTREKTDDVESAKPEAVRVPFSKPRPPRACKSSTTKPPPLPEKETENITEKPAEEKEREEGDAGTYENTDAPNIVDKTGTAETEMYEVMDYDGQSSSAKPVEQNEPVLREEETSFDVVECKFEEKMDSPSADKALPLSSPSTEEQPASVEKQPSAEEKQPSAEEYEQMDVGNGEGGKGEGDEDSHDYEKPDGWNNNEASPAGSQRSSVGFVPTGVIATDLSKGKGIYDIPRPACTSLDDAPSTVSAPTTPVSEMSGNDLRPQPSPDAARRSHSISSVGSGSSGQSDTASVSVKARVGSAVRESLSSTRSNSLGTADGGHVERAGGERLNSYERKRSVDSSDSVSGTLQQAREVLRLARAMKAEAEQMKAEAYRELELARRERHDASLLKKNAAEILKIAKYKLPVK